MSPADAIEDDAARAGIGPYRDLSGRALEPWVRRTFLCILGLVVAAALLNAFGQHPATTRAAGASAGLEVQSPADLRGGLIFQTRITVRARARLKKPTIVLQRGWFESMSVNSIEPNPTQMGTRDGSISMTFAPLAAGRSLVVWLYFQANPTNIGKRSQDVELDDGAHMVAKLHRSVTVWP